MDKRIVIAQRLRPFSHEPGTKCLLPGSTHEVTIYPALIVINKQEIPIPLTGPVQDFTVQLDLEKGYVKVWGHYVEGFLRYRIQANTDGSFSIITEKSPLENLFPQEMKTPYQPQSEERLSLGSHKAQDWSLVSRRADLSEIFPVWFRLGQLLPHSHSEDIDSLLSTCQQQIFSREKLKIFPSFLNLFRAGFDSILAPRLIDTQHQGFPLPPVGKGSPLALLTEGSKLIRSLFFSQEGNKIEILPLLPPEFHAGRFVSISCGALGTLDMEWTKKSLRRLVFHSHTNSEIQFIFPKELKSYRLEGERHTGL